MKPEDLKMILPSTALIKIKTFYGFVTIDEEDDPKKIIETLNKTYFNGNKIKARLSMKSNTFSDPKRENQTQVKKDLNQVGDDFSSEKKEYQEKDEGDTPKNSLNLENLKRKFENKPYSRLEKPKEGADFSNEKKEVQEKNEGGVPKYSLNLQNLKHKFENQPLSKLEKPKESEILSKKVEENLKFKGQQRSPQQIYLEAISKLKNPYEFKEDYPYREDFALGPRLKERGFK